MATQGDFTKLVPSGKTAMAQDRAAQEVDMPEQQALAPRAQIVMDERGLPILDTDGKRASYLTRILASKMVPAHITNLQQAEQIWDLISQMGLPPQNYWHLTYYARGKLGVMSDLIMAACRASGQLEYCKILFLDKDNAQMTEANAATFETFCCLAKAKRKGEPDELRYRFTVKQAEAAGLMKNEVWRTYTEDMLMHKARTRVLRNLFTDCAGGHPCKEDMLGVDPMLDDDGKQIRSADGALLYASKQERMERARAKLSAAIGESQVENES